MLVVTAGGWAEHYAPRGINGPIDDILFPIQHGMLFYPGFEVLPPLVFYRTDKLDATALRHAARRWPGGWIPSPKRRPFPSVGRITATI
jgi:putative NADPH-quinone reductase